MIEHSKSVRKGVKKSLMIVDMPFNTYKNKFQALKNCKKVLKETKCDGIKLEGGRKLNGVIRYLTKNKIPVMGHIGITGITYQWSQMALRAKQSYHFGTKLAT